MYKRILVPMDGSETAERGLREAIGIASAVGAAVVVLNVALESSILMEGMTMAYYKEATAMLVRDAREMVGKASKAVAAAGVACETAVIEATAGSAWETIIEQVGRRDCDLVVMGTHGRRGLKRLTLGSDAELVVRHARVPVMLVNTSTQAT